LDARDYILLRTVLVGGSGMVCHNLTKVSDLQIRLVRASELTRTEGNELAAAGLAHETRNPAEHHSRVRR